MRYEIFGGNLPALTMTLDQGESIYTQSGGMTWMSEHISMDTNIRGGFKKGVGRMFSGESLFQATYTAQQNNQELTCASTFPGGIVDIDLSTGREYICQKTAFLCAQTSVELSAHVHKGVGGGLFGGEGFVLQHIAGKGLAFLELNGSVRKLNLLADQKVKVDTGHVAMFETTIGYSVESIKGFKNVLFGGEGLFLTTLKGPGMVWLQTMNMRAFAHRLIPYMPMRS